MSLTATPHDTPLRSAVHQRYRFGALIGGL
jgi:cyanophycinase-like exopeptidase